MPSLAPLAVGLALSVAAFVPSVPSLMGAPALIAVPQCDQPVDGPQSVVAGVTTRLRTVCTSTLPRVLLVSARHGAVRIDARGVMDYTPDGTHRGLDVVTVTLPVADGPSSYSTSFEVEVIGAAVAVDDTFAVAADPTAGARPDATPIAGALPGSVLDNDVLTGPGWVVQLGSTPPRHGTLDVDPHTGAVRYTPDPGFAGTDTVLYRLVVLESGAVSNVARVTLVVG